MVPTGARIRMCESIAKLAKARKSKIAQDDTAHDPSNGRFTSGSGGSTKPAKKSDASNPDHKWGSWKEFNDDYTKALQKRNAAAREHDKATRTGQESPKTAAKLERAKAFADAHTNHPNRPSSSVTYNFNRPRIGQDSAVCRLVRARRPKVAQDADWDEGKHKRASNGQFGSGGGGGVNVKHAEQRLAARETQRKHDVSMGKARQDANGAARSEALKKTSGGGNADTVHSGVGRKTSQQELAHGVMHSSGFSERTPTYVGGKEKAYTRNYGGGKPVSPGATSSHLKIEPNGSWNHTEWFTAGTPDKVLGSGSDHNDLKAHLNKISGGRTSK